MYEYHWTGVRILMAQFSRSIEIQTTEGKLDNSRRRVSEGQSKCQVSKLSAHSSWAPYNMLSHEHYKNVKEAGNIDSSTNGASARLILK
jgi:hypothetical protein